MEPSEVDIPRSIMDPAPPPPVKSKSSNVKKILLIIGIILAVAALIGGGYYVYKTFFQTDSSASQEAAAPTVTPTPTPEEDIIETAATKQVSVDGRTFTHIVPNTWKTAGSEGDLQIDSEIPGTGSNSTQSVVMAIRYNQGTYTLNPAAPAGTHCDRIVNDSEEVKVSPTEERYINYCGKMGPDGKAVFVYVLFTKYNYKDAKVLTATEQADLFQNVLMYGRIVPDDDEALRFPFNAVENVPDFTDMIEIFRSIQYVEVQT